MSKKGSINNPTIILDKRTSVHLSCLHTFYLEDIDRINIADGEFIITKHRLLHHVIASKIVAKDKVFWYFDDVDSIFKMMQLIRAILLYLDVPDTQFSKFYALNIIGKHHVIQTFKGLS